MLSHTEHFLCLFGEMISASGAVSLDFSLMFRNTENRTAVFAFEVCMCLPITPYIRQKFCCTPKMQGNIPEQAEFLLPDSNVTRKTTVGRPNNH